MRERRLLQHLHVLGVAAEEPGNVRLWERVARDPSQFYNLVATGVAPLRLAETDGGAKVVADDEMVRLDAITAQAVAEQDYLLAAEVHALRQALAPAASDPPAELPGQREGDVDAQLAFFAQWGYVRLPQCLRGEQLRYPCNTTPRPSP